MVDNNLVDFIKSLPLQKLEEYLKLIQPVAISKHNKNSMMLNPHLKLTLNKVKYF